jgi:hypothetical protein
MSPLDSREPTTLGLIPAQAPPPQHYSCRSTDDDDDEEEEEEEEKEEEVLQQGRKEGRKEGMKSKEEKETKKQRKLQKLRTRKLKLIPAGAGVVKRVSTLGPGISLRSYQTGLLFDTSVDTCIDISL